MTSELEGTMLRRDGHVSSVGIDRYLYEDLVPAQRRIVETHMADCTVCAARIQEAREADDAAVIPPMPELVLRRAEPMAKVVPLWRRGPVLGAAAAAMAASLVLVLWTAPPAPDGGSGSPTEEFVRKGAGFTMHVVVDDGAGGRVLTSGDAVRPGDNLGFRIHPERDGYVMIVGSDQTNAPYPCFPQTSIAAARVEASAEPFALKAAVELDDVLGAERIVGVLCPEPFEFGTLSEALRASPQGTVPLAGCSTEEVVVVKKVEP